MDKQKVDKLLVEFQKLKADEKKHFLQELICPGCEIDYVLISKGRNIEEKGAKPSKEVQAVKQYCCIHDFFRFLEMTKEESEMFRDALELYQKT